MLRRSARIDRGNNHDPAMARRSRRKELTGKSRSNNDPALGQNDELVRLVSLDDFDDPTPGAGGGFCRARPLIAGIGEDAFDEGEQAACAVIENQSRAVAILNIGGVNDDVQEQAERIDEDVPLAARNLLARIKALRVECRAPF
jgi:hypothetical protein